jgi:hypothetical protein
MAESRIPTLTGTSKKAANAWLKELHKRNLLFCLDDNPSDLFLISDGSRMFTDNEATEVSGLLERLFDKRGDELHGLAYETLSKTFHTRAERRAFKVMYG